MLIKYFKIPQRGRWVAFLLVFLAACDYSGQEDARILRLNLHSGLNTLDPAHASNESSVWMCQQLFSTLLSMDSTGQLVPDAARDYTVSADGLQYTFRLRRNLYFHPHPAFGADSTRSLVAQDFAYSIHRVCHRHTGSPGLWVFRNTLAGAADYHARQADSIAGIQCPNDSTLVLRLRAPYGPFAQLLTMPYAAAVPQEVVAQLGKDFRKQPIGTGPFRFFRWEEGRLLALHAHPHYHEAGLPRVDALAVSFIPSKLGAFSALLEGRLHFIDGLDPTYRDALLTRQGTLAPEYRNKLQLFSGPQLSVEYIGIHTQRAPFDDARVRRALQLATDRAALASHVLRNTVLPAGAGFVPPGLASSACALGAADNTAEGSGQAAPLRYPYLPDSARALLRAAGYGAAKRLPPLRLYTTGSHAELASQLQQQWQAVGFQVRVEVEDPGALRQQIRQGNIGLWRASWVADYADAENFLSLFYQPNHPPAGSNTSRYANAAFDSLYAQLDGLHMQAQQCHVLDQMEDLLAQDSPVIPLYYYKIWRPAATTVRGLPHSPLNLSLPLKYVWLEE